MQSSNPIHWLYRGKPYNWRQQKRTIYKWHFAIALSRLRRLNMKQLFLPSLGILALILCACGSGAATLSTLSPDQIAADVHTAVGLTVTAGANSALSTPAATLTPSPPPTSIAIPTLTVIPTASAIPYYYYSTGSDCNDSVYIKDVSIPDGTVLAPGGDVRQNMEA